MDPFSGALAMLTLTGPLTARAFGRNSGTLSDAIALPGALACRASCYWHDNVLFDYIRVFGLVAHAADDDRILPFFHFIEEPVNFVAHHRV